jgi:hypothetical protein
VRKCDGCKKVKVRQPEVFCESCKTLIVEIRNKAREACDREGIPYDKTED